MRAKDKSRQRKVKQNLHTALHRLKEVHATLKPDTRKRTRSKSTVVPVAYTAALKKYEAAKTTAKKYIVVGGSK